MTKLKNPKFILKNNDFRYRYSSMNVTSWVNSARAGICVPKLASVASGLTPRILMSRLWPQTGGVTPESAGRQQTPLPPLGVRQNCGNTNQHHVLTHLTSHRHSVTSSRA